MQPANLVQSFALTAERYREVVKNLGKHVTKSEQSTEERELVREMLGGPGTVFTRDGRAGAPRIASAKMLPIGVVASAEMLPGRSSLRLGLSRLPQPLSPLPNPCMPRARCVERVAHHSRNRPLGASTGRVPRLHR
jgi:hypothetical protein